MRPETSVGCGVLMETLSPAVGRVCVPSSVCEETTEEVLVLAGALASGEAMGWVTWEESAGAVHAVSRAAERPRAATRRAKFFFISCSLLSGFVFPCC